MTQILRKSTAVDVLIGPFVDKTDGSTAETGESPRTTAVTIKLSKNGQALAAKNDVTMPVHDADGYYNCELEGICNILLLSTVTCGCNVINIYIAADIA